MTLTSWTYTAIDADGEKVDGELRAASRGDAVARVRRLGHRPARVEQRRVSLFTRDVEIALFSPRVKPAELAGAVRQFAAMLGAGVHMLRALGVLQEQSSSPAMQTAWKAVRADVEAGETLSVALAGHPRVFDTVFVSLVRAGEASGALDDVLEQAADSLERRAELRRRVRSALAYPIAVLVLVAVVVMAMSVFVVPVFRDIYADLGSSLPTPTRFVLAITGFLGSNVVLIAAATVAAVVGLRRWKATPDGGYRIDRAVLMLPAIGPLVQRTMLARTARTLAVLLEAGVPLLEALDIAAHTSPNAVMSDTVLAAGEAVRNGRPLSGELAASGRIPPLFTQVVAVGEESGDLDSMLGVVADIYESEVDSAASTFSSVVEPLLVAFLGIVVGGLVLALYLPMFRLVDLVQ